MSKKIILKIVVDEDDLQRVHERITGANIEDIVAFDCDGKVIQLPQELVELLNRCDTNVLGVA